MVGILYHLNSFMHVSRFMIHSTSIECSDAVQCPVASSLVVQASGETQEYPVGEMRDCSGGRASERKGASVLEVL